MNGPLDDVLEQLLAAYRSGRPLVLLFDYDGTLVPIVEHPSLAELPSWIGWLLQQLAKEPRLHVGVLSGRALDDLKKVVGLSGLYYCGTSGLELELDGRRLTPPQFEKMRPLLEGLALELQEAAAPYPGAWVEKKPLGITAHYRAVKPQQVPDFRANVALVLKPDGIPWQVLDGPMAFEITPDLGWTKGSALRRIVAHVGERAMLLYAGDDVNDNSALEAAAALGGVALGIGSRAPRAAQHHLPDSAALISFLSRLQQALHGPLPGK